MASPNLTDEQLLEAVKVYVENGGNMVRGGAAMPGGGMGRTTFQHRIREAERRRIGLDLFAQLRGDVQRGLHPPAMAEVPPGLTLKGTSVRYNGEGEIEQQWDKTRTQGRDPAEAAKLADPKKIVKLSTLYDQQGRVTQQWISEKPEDEQREALWRAFADGLSKEIKKAAPVKMPKGKPHKDLLAVYPVGDHHTGMMAWPQETEGEPWDLKIAEETIREASIRLIDSCPPCEQALIPFMGDFFHYDSFAAVTPAHKNLLDADGRYPKMVEVGVRIIRHMIAAALERHRHVTVIFEGGNHDPSTAACIRIMLACLYEKEPRVKIDTSPASYHYFEFGEVLIGTHHGDKAKMDKLPGIMAHDRSEAWGRTTHRLWITAHNHKDTRQEFPGCFVESVGVLPPTDAYAAGAGYRSQRSMKAIVFHREDGEVERHTVNPEMFRDRKRRAA